jgi:16S rRNA processing protein RimM
VSQPDSRPTPSDLLVVGRIGRAHGVRGEVSVEPHTDDPDLRFAVGARLETDRRDGATLTVASRKWHSGRLILSFEGTVDRNGAEVLRGVQLLMVAGDRPALEDPDDFYDSDLVGLRAVDTDGLSLGIVTDVLHTSGADLLAIDVNGQEKLVPFLQLMVPTIDLAAGVVVIDAPDGLFDL